ncbi:MULTISPECIES: hypothetical protein [Staphylococcus]|uniref:hypothetical protein n=1 Tax=Staphylococcus TaxID=1279 RepID=UPI00115AA056|nr:MULTISPECIES: hypothetical protein [Staphylococcus]MCY1607583.1 hypothetical protein [Staphylococcus pettenkoferi]MCY6990961.1 hypothetical protein [Staphylococcus argensis]
MRFNEVIKKQQNHNEKQYEYGSVDYEPERAHYRYKEKRLNCGPKGIRAHNPDFIEWADERILTITDRLKHLFYMQNATTLSKTNRFLVRQLYILGSMKVS